MKRIFSYLFGAFLFFLLILPLNNQAFASPVGSSCIVGNGVPNGGCDTTPNLICDTSGGTCNVGGCTGVCRAFCAVHPGGPANGGCTGTDICHIVNSTPGGQNGYCIPEADKGGLAGHTCVTTLANKKQGNCAAGLTCNTASDKACGPGVPAGCRGYCFPDTYQCNNPNLPNHFTCPSVYTCGGYDPKCNSTSVGTAYQQVPNCKICAPTIDSQITCKCKNPEKSGAGNNGYTCDNRLLPSQEAFCSNDETCYDDPKGVVSRKDVFGGAELHGIRCTNPDDVPLPPPPDPPCFAWGANGGCAEILSAIGNIQTQPGPFILRVFYTLMALSGGVAVLLLMRSGYQIMMSRGNAEGMQKGREQFTATVVGLLFLIFSFVLFQTIVVDILKIPGFG
jgi:hypothetical protein